MNLDRAFALARAVPPRATSPNPRVGCVLVKGGKIVAEGAHQGFGCAHAEPIAIGKAGRRAKGATVFVTMEPCAPFPGKKTPSCATALVAAGVSKVICATLDPNPKVSGRGLALLREAGVKTEVDASFRDAAAELNRGFFSLMTRNRPWVILKTALSLDGKAAAVNGKSRWVTGEPARNAAHALRAEYDAILVGAGTVLADNPSLTAHGAGENPLRVVLTGRRTMPKRAKVFDKSAPTVVYKKTPLKAVLRDLAKRGVGTLLVEGGPTVHASFLKEGLVDEAKVYLAPKLLSGATDPNKAPRLKSPAVTKLGDDWLISGVLS